MSSADRVKISWVKEVTPGTTPNNPAFKAARLTGESLKVMFQTEQSKELDPNRVERELIKVGESVGGDLNHELLWDAHEDFIAAVLGRSTWTVDGVNPKIKRIANGNDQQSFSILKQFEDLSNVNHLFKGLMFNTWALTIPKKAIMTGVFGVTGMGFANGAMPLGMGAPTFAAATNTDPYNSSSHITSILLDDVPFTSCIDQLSLSVTNNLRPQECLGSAAPTGFTQGKIQITGSADIYFKTEDLFNKYKNATAFELDLGLTDNDTNKLDFELPRCKFEDMEIVASGGNTDIIAKCKFRALWDPTDQRVIQITSTAP